METDGPEKQIAKEQKPKKTVRLQLSIPEAILFRRELRLWEKERKSRDFEANVSVSDVIGNKIEKIKRIRKIKIRGG